MKTAVQKRRGPTLALVIILLMGMVISAHAQADHPIVAAAWSPDGHTVAYVSADGQLQLVDAGTGQLFQLPYSASTKVALSEWSPSGAQLAVAAAGGSIVIWNVDRTSKSGQVAAILTGHEETVYSLAWNASGDYLASVSWEEPYTLRIWDMKRHQLQMEASAGNLYQVAWSPAGTTLAVNGIGGTWLFDTQSVLGEQEQGVSTEDLDAWAIPIGPSKPTVPVVWHPDGVRIAVGDFDGTIYVVNVTTNTITMTIPNADIIAALASDPTGQYLAGASRNYDITVWDWQTGEPLETIKNNARSRSLGFSPYGERLVYASAQPTVAGDHLETTQSYAEGRVHITVLNPSLDQLQGVARQCPTELSGIEVPTDRDQLPAFIEQLSGNRNVSPCIQELAAIGNVLQSEN